MALVNQVKAWDKVDLWIGTKWFFLRSVIKLQQVENSILTSCELAGSVEYIAQKVQVHCRTVVLITIEMVVSGSRLLSL